MIRINLLGKKQAAGGLPFGLDETLSKLGITAADLAEMRPGLVRAALLIFGLYLGAEVPVYFYEKRLAELEAELAVHTDQLNKVTAELASKKDIRAQMQSLEQQENELQRQLNAISALQKDRSLAFRTVDAMVTSLPPKVWFNRLDYKNRLISIEGSCWEYFPINDFIKKISESTQYTEVNFKKIQATPPANPVPDVPEAMQKIKIFSLDFRVKGSGEI